MGTTTNVEAESGAEAPRTSHVTAERRERAVLELSATLASSLVLEDVLSTVARRIGEIMDVWWVDIWNYSSERDALIYEAYWCRGGVTDEDLAFVGTVTPLDERPEFRRLLEGGRAVECHIDDPDLAPEERAAYESGARRPRSTRRSCSAIGSSARSASARPATCATSPTTSASCSSSSASWRPSPSTTPRCSAARRSRRGSWPRSSTRAGPSPRPSTWTRCSTAWRARRRPRSP